MKQTKTTIKAAAADKAFEAFSKTMAARIEEMLKGASAAWKQPWFSEGTGWPTNAEGRAYNGTNALVLMMLCEEKGYRRPVFATYNAVEALNPAGTPQESRAHVLKGEKSFPVLYTSPTARSRQTGVYVPMAQYEEMTAEEQKEYRVRNSIRVFRVFNIAQTNLQQARPELWEKLAGGSRKQQAVDVYAPLDAMIACETWHCPIKETAQGSAYYSVGKDEIVLPKRGQFLDGEAFALTAFHEMAHSTGHKDRLGRLADFKGSEDYAREELVAELTAAMVGARHGMQKHLKEDSVAYLKCWLERLKKDSGFIRTVLADVCKAGQMIEERIDEASKAAERRAKGAA